MPKIFNRSIQLIGETRTINSVKITPLEYDVNGRVLLATGTTKPTDGSAGYAVGSMFIKTNGSAGSIIYFNQGSVTSSSFSAFSTTGGGGTSTFEDLYSLDAELTATGNANAVSSALFKITGAPTSAYLAYTTLLLTGAANQTGAVLTITNSGSGNDVTGTSSTWSVTKTGAATFVSVAGCNTVTAATNLDLEATGAGTITIAGTSTGAVTIGAASAVLTTIQSNSNTGATLTVTNATQTTYAGMVKFTGAGITTGTGLLGTFAALTTGLGLSVVAAATTTGSVVRATATDATLTTGYYFEAYGGASTVFSVGQYGAVVIAGNAATNVLTLTAGNAVITAGTLTLTNGALSVTKAANATTATITNNTATAATLLAIAGSGVFTGTTTTSFMTVTASGLTTGTVMYVPSAALTTGNVLQMTADAITTGAVITATSASAVLTSGKFLTITWNPATYTGAGITAAGLVSIADSPTISTSVTGSHNDLNVTRTNTTAAAVITYTVSGSIVKIVNAAPTVGAGSTLTDSAIVLDVQQNNTAASTGVVAAFTQLAGAGATNAVTITANSVTTSTGVLTITANGLTTGVAQLITSTGVIATTGALLSLVGNSATTTNGLLQISGTGLTSGVGLLVTGGGANMAAAGAVVSVNMGAATTGNGVSIVSTGVYTSAGAGTGLLSVTGNSATTTTGLVQISGTGLTTGVGLLITGSGATFSTGSLINVAMGAATVGAGLTMTTTGIYTGAGVLQITANSATTGTVAVITGNGLTTGSLLSLASTGVYTGTGAFSLTANSATSGTVAAISATGLTTGKGLTITAAAATLTTGFYLAANDGGLNVFTIGANGHLTSNQTTAPTIAVTVQAGITAAAITAGSSDTCGSITTTGTSTGGTILTITFNKTYTVAPKAVVITGANAAGGNPNTVPYVSSITATTFVLTIPAGGTYAATPSYYYQVIA